DHMAFKGTHRSNAIAISVEIESVGVHLNAYPSRENTAYYARVLADDVPLALDIVADILQHSVFDETELARERTVVLQEIGQAEDTPDDIIFDHFQATAYPGQAIGRPVLGTSEIVRELSRKAIAGYLAENYGADRLLLVSSGKVDHDRLVELSTRLFSGMPARGALAADAARYGGGEFRAVRDLEQVHLVLGFEGIGYQDADFYAASVLSTVLGGGMSSRLFQEIREKRGLVYSIYSFASSYSDGGVFGVYAGTGESEVAEVMPVMCEGIARLAQTLE